MSEFIQGSVGEPAPQPRRRLATWAVVAITLGSVLGAALLFGAGFVVGVVTTSAAESAGALPGGTTSGSSDTAPGGGTGSATGDAPASGFDECLVGTWRTTDYVQKTTGPDGDAVLTGLNRTFTFDATGRHVVTYDQVEAILTVGDAKSTLTFDGTVVYQVSLSGSQMSFSLTSAEGSMTVQPEKGDKEVRDLQPGTGSVTYTCEGDTYTEEDGRGFREVAGRVS